MSACGSIHLIAMDVLGVAMDVLGNPIKQQAQKKHGHMTMRFFIND